MKRTSDDAADEEAGEKTLLFSATAYVLDCCRLDALEEGDVVRISHALASMEPWRTLGYRTEGLARYLTRSDPGLFRYAVTVPDTDSDSSGGIVCVRYPWLLGPYVELLALFGTVRNRGAGRTIIEWIEAQTREGSKNVWATVSSFNHAALEFYKQTGFVEVAPLHDLVSPGHDEILLRKIRSGELTCQL